MPPKKFQKESLIILVNIGRTHETENENEPSFLEKSKQVMKLLIQRKIFLRPKDEVGVIVMGSSKSENRMSCENIEELGPMQIPMWDLVEIIDELKGTENCVDWVEGITLAIEYINTECLGSMLRRLVLLTDFNEKSDVIEQYDIETIAADLREAEIDLLAIGNKQLDGDSEIELNPSEEAFVNFCKKTEGKIMTFDDTIPKLMIYKDQSKTPMPWKVEMDLFDINIPVVVYLKTTEDFKLPKWQFFENKETEKVPVERSRALVDKDKQIVDEEDIITGHMYGRKFIPFTDDDKAALQYESGPKCFTIYGFTKQELVSMDCLAGKGSYIVVPEDQFASPFYSLVKAMVDTNRVALVRRVYRANTAPKMGVLIPQLDSPGQPACLIYIELIFAEDRRIVQVKPIKSTMNELSEEQEEVIGELIDSMNLMEIEDDITNEKKEAFEAGLVCDISRQYMWDKLTHRALYPDLPLPPMSDFLKKMLEPPKSVQYKSKPVLQSIARLFPMQVVQEKKVNRKALNDKTDDRAEAKFEDVEENTQGPEVPKEETNITNISQEIENEDEELYQIAESVEAASQAMDVDLDDLANSM